MAFGPATDPLMTIAELRVWAQDSTIADDDAFALQVIAGMSVEVRHYGKASWTYATLPGRARNVMHIAVKNYYLNPTGLKQETVGPLNESKAPGFSQNFELTDAQKQVLAEVAGKPGPLTERSSFWVMPTSSGEPAAPADHLVDVAGWPDGNLVPFAKIGDNLYPPVP